MNNSQKRDKNNFGLDQDYQYSFTIQNLNDLRTSQQIQIHSKYTTELTKKNIQIYKFNQLSKIKTKPLFSKLIKVEVGNGWFGMITDNNIQSDIAVLTTHGLPGSQKQWANLQAEMGGEVRWINFVIPGFDDLDERRGDYSGSVQDFCKLIILILKKRGVKEFIYCGFSGGSYNVAVMYHLYPNLMIGEINLVGCGYTWPVGLMLSAKLIVNDSGFGFGPRGIEQINQRKKQKAYKKYLRTSNQIKFSQNSPYIQLNKFAFCHTIKTSNCFPEGPKVPFQIRKYHMNILRIVAHAQNDVVIKKQISQQYIYGINHDKNRYKITDNILKKNIQWNIYQKYGITFDVNKLQQYFCIIFPKAIHYIQMTKHKELAKMFKVYITVLRVIREHERNGQSKL